MVDGDYVTNVFIFFKLDQKNHGAGVRYIFLPEKWCWNQYNFSHEYAEQGLHCTPFVLYELSITFLLYVI